MAKQLFDDDDDGDGNGNDNGNVVPRPQPPAQVLKVNQEYAKRFAHNKQREALHRLQELKKRGVVDSSDDESSDEESSDDGFIPSSTEVRILDTLAKIKKKDPSIYSQEVKFFDDEKDGDEDSAGMEEGTHKKMPKPVYLKDAIAKQLIEEGSDFDEDDPKGKRDKHIMTYAEEQQELKDEFLRNANINEEEADDGDAGRFLKLRKKHHDDSQEGTHQSVADKVIEERLEEYFGRDETLDENEKFLKDYLLKKSWVDEDESQIPAYEDIVGDLIEDEEELEKQDKYEAEYNFRFEEGMSSQVIGHSRVVEDSVRRKDDKRKKSRLKKKERLAEADFERREELKRLKNIKKKEIVEKLEKIRSVAGANDSGPKLLKVLGDDELEEDFDPEEYDKKMKEVFGEEYYGAEDPDENFEGYDVEELQKPDFDAEDEFLGLTKERGEHEGGNRNSGFDAAQQRVKQLKPVDLHIKKEDTKDENDVSNDLVNMESAEPEEEFAMKTNISKRKKKGKIPLREKLAFDKTLDEYYKLDYEDMIGDLPTRFKYKEVKPNMYGLTAEEILITDDKDLNQYVSLKKIAPYTTVEWKPKFRLQSSQKIRKKEALKRHSVPQSSKEHKGVLSTGGVGDAALSAAIENLKQEGHQTVVGVDGSKSKRKRRKKGLSLSESRLIAYGKLAPSSKRKKRT